MPTTPTGKRLGHEGFCVPARTCTCRVLIFDAIESEAAAMERERLRALAAQMAISLSWSSGFYEAIVSWLRDPDDIQSPDELAAERRFADESIKG